MIKSVLSTVFQKFSDLEVSKVIYYELYKVQWNHTAKILKF